MFVAGLRLGIPYAELLTMRLGELLMMLESQIPPDSGGGRGQGDEVRWATQSDIDRFMRM